MSDLTLTVWELQEAMRAYKNARQNSSFCHDEVGLYCAIGAVWKAARSFQTSVDQYGEKEAIKLKERIDVLAMPEKICNWNEDIVCASECSCETCQYNLPAEQKKNGQNPPVKIIWDDDYMGKAPKCPACGEFAYFTDRCFFCGQKFKQDDPELIEYKKPPKEERMDCFWCGGHNTMVGTRAKINGHFHGACEKCGIKIIE